LFDQREIEQNPDIRFGWHLRPSYAMCRAQAELHDLLERQYGLVAGGAFMPHATIKGFFRSDASLPEVGAAFDRAVAGHAPFPVVNRGPIPFGRSSIVLDVHHMEDGSRNEALQAIHESAWREITPLVHPECDCTPVEGALDRFYAHLTLIMADMPAFAFDEIFEFVGEARPIGPERFTAEYFHLFAFHSEEWQGAWWSSLTWKLLHTWRLEA
jgi:hypothetical protein